MKNWEKNKIIDFCYVTDFVANGSFASLSENVTYINQPDYAVLVRLTDFTKKWSKDFVYVSKSSFDFLKKSSLQPGDLIMSNVGEPGIVFLVPNLKQPMTLGPNSILIRPNKNSSTSKFLYLYFLSKIGKNQIDLISTGAAQKKFNKTSFRELEIPLPPLLEQQHIVAILDKAFETIDKAKANAEQNLKNSKELFESYLQSVFKSKGEGWEEKTLGEIIDNIITGPFGSALHKSDYVEDGIPVVNPQNIVNGQIVSLQKTMINVDTFSRLKKYSLQLGDIVIARRGEMGRCAIVKSENVGWLCGTGCFIIRVDRKKADREFLNIFLSSTDVKKQLEKSSIGATMSNLNQSILSELSLNVPALKTQKTIVQKLNTISSETKKLEAIYQNKIKDLDELKRSILQKAFSGELTSAIKVAKTISLPTSVANISTTDLQAGIVAIALQKHLQQGNMNTFHHVKTEKIVHLSEAILNIDLERNPYKDAAGPNDFAHAKKVEQRAQKAGFFSVQKMNNLYEYKAGTQIQKVVDKTKTALKDKTNQLTELIDFMVPMTTQQAEIVATVYAAWNNLLLDNAEITDEAIVTEARENWHPDKLKIPREKFFNALTWMKGKDIFVPKGQGKKVMPKVIAKSKKS